MFKPLKPSQALRPLSLTMCLALGATALTGCAATPKPVTIRVPDMLATPCPRPDPSDVSTIGDLATFSIRQEAALGVCDARRAALVEVIGAHTTAVTPAPWWAFRRR